LQSIVVHCGFGNVALGEREAYLCSIAPSAHLKLVLAPDADPEAKQFIGFLMTDRGAAIMKTGGWVR
jgi:hypothetical protein